LTCVTYRKVIDPTGSVYRGCVAYKITSLNNAEIERNPGSGAPVASLVVDEHGDFNGACGYVAELTGSGIMMSGAFTTQTPVFRLFATGEQL